MYNCIHVSSTIAIFSHYLNTEYFLEIEILLLTEGGNIFKYNPLPLAYGVVTKYLIGKFLSQSSKYATDDFNLILVILF